MTSLHTSLQSSLPPFLASFFRRVLPVLMLCVIAVLPAQAYTVVIDAGHGGKDHGAIDNNVREKDINLGVALKLAKLLRKQHKDIKVVLTRDKDEYLTLQRRADIANKAKGDLFISIHTNSVAESNPNRKTVAGASTYTLGLDKDKANMDVARRENSVVTLESDYEKKYAGFDPDSDESYIIFEMAQKSNLAQSAKFADEVQKQMSKVAGRKNRGVHQAGFWVLWATSMPSALVELDFICNPNSAKYIASEQGQQKLAQALCNATGEYFDVLAKHEKERLRSGDTPADSEESVAREGEVVLAAVNVSERESKEAPALDEPRERTRRPAARRRRSRSARAESEQQEYAVAVIPEQVQYVAEQPAEEQLVAMAEPEKDVTASEKKSNKKKAKNKKQSDKKQSKQLASNKSAKKDKNKGSGSQPVTRKVNGKTVYVVTNPATPANSSAGDKKQAVASANAQAQAQAKQTEHAEQPKQSKKHKEVAQTQTSPVRLAKVNTVYKIQIYSCDKILKEKDPLFGGLYPVTCSKTGDSIYTYYYGESRSQGEIYRLLSDVQKVFPEAKVVKARHQ